METVSRLLVDSITRLNSAFERFVPLLPCHHYQALFNYMLNYTVVGDSAASFTLAKRRETITLHFANVFGNLTSNVLVTEKR